MSGAGRGIPRVSPSPVAPSPPSGTPGNIVEVPTSKFVYRAGAGVTNFPLSSSFQFVAEVPLPLGVSRAALDLFYNRAAAGVGQLALKIGWLGVNNVPLYVPAGESLGIVDFSQKEIRFGTTADASMSALYSMAVPPAYLISGANLSLSFQIYAAELGATGGTLTISDVFADNISDLPYEPNFTV
jgi:hypothetical protein